jgi:phage terminase large subunit-like protein
LAGAAASLDSPGFLAVFLACFYDWSGVLAVGERGTGMVIAPDRRQARTCFRYIASFLDHVPMLRAMVEKRTREAIHLKNGISIEVHTASFRAVRGYTVIFAILDEVDS